MVAPPSNRVFTASIADASATSVSPADRWRWPPLLKASAIGHLGFGAAALAQPALWLWLLDPAVMPAMLDLLDARRMRATFFAIAVQAARHPLLCRETFQRGHVVENLSHEKRSSCMHTKTSVRVTHRSSPKPIS